MNSDRQISSPALLFSGRCYKSVLPFNMQAINNLGYYTKYVWCFNLGFNLQLTHTPKCLLTLNTLTVI